MIISKSLEDGSLPSPNNPPDFIPDHEAPLEHIPDFVPDNQWQSDEDRYGGLMGGAKAFGAGIARGATFGGSDVALTKTGLVAPETLKGLQNTNPAASFAGEMTGTIAPALVGDEASLANLPGLVTRGGRAVEAAIGKGAIAKGAGFAAEGAAYGLGQSISENALGDHDLVSEKTLANIGLSAGLTGGFGALVGKVSPLISDTSSAEEKLAASKLGPEVPGETASDKLSLMRALAKQKDNASEIRDAGNLIGAPVLPGQTSASKFVQDATSAMSKAPTIPGVTTQQALQKGFDAVDGVIKDSLGTSEHLSPYDAGALIKEQVQNTVDRIYQPIKEAYGENSELGKNISLPDEARIKVYDNLVKQSQDFGSVGSNGGKLIREFAEKALAQDNVNQLDQLISEIGEQQRGFYKNGQHHESQALGQVVETLRDFQDKQIAKQEASIPNLRGAKLSSLEEDGSISLKHKDVNATGHFMHPDDLPKISPEVASLGYLRPFHIDSVETKAAKQGEGLGSSALFKLEQEATKKGADGFTLNVKPEDLSKADDVVRFNEKNGYSVLSRNENGVVMHKPLGTPSEALESAKAEDIINKRQETRRQYKEFKETLNDLASDQRLGKKNLTHGAVENVLDSIPNEKVLDKMFDPKNADGLARLQKNFPEVFHIMIEQKKSQILQGAMVDGKVNIGKVMRAIYDEKKLSSKVREMMFPPEVLERLNASKTWMESLPKDINPSGTSQAEAYKEFLTHPLSAAGKNFMGYVTNKLIEKFASSPEEAAKVTTIINTERAAKKTMDRVQDGIKSLFDKNARPVTAKIFSKISSASDYKEKTKDIKKIANNPQAMSDAIDKSVNGFYDHAPNISSGLQQAMVRGTQFLNSKIPTHEIGLFEKEPEMSASEIAQFKNYYDTVHDPISALDQVKNGTIIPDTVEALSAVFPRLYDEMKQEMLAAMTSIKDPDTIPYSTRQAVSFFLGEPIDKSLSPQAIQANQMAFQSPSQGEPQAGPSKGGMGKITLGKRMGLNHGEMEA